MVTSVKLSERSKRALERLQADFVLRRGQRPTLQAVLERAVELTPDGAGSHNDLGFAYLQLGRYEQAAVAFGEAIHLDPGSGRAYFNLGLALEKLGHREDAVLCIQRAMELDPGLRVQPSP